jgi:formate dehydrogenase maturation protein FdhE
MNEIKQKLTEKQKREYIQAKYNECPFCSSPHISADFSAHEGLQAWRTVRCQDCKGEWRDVYILHTVEDVD